MAEPLLLYSTNSWLAWAISSKYYGVHWVWCSSFFRANGTAAAGFPPSAVPGAIYDRVYEDVVRGDRHSVWIAKNRVGVLKGAECKHDDGTISTEQKMEIVAIVNASQIADFMPLLYVIPLEPVKKLLRAVSPHERAHPMSIEYIIEALPDTAFDMIDVRNVLHNV